jgi:hypothetical protein
MWRCFDLVPGLRTGLAKEVHHFGNLWRLGYLLARTLTQSSRRNAPSFATAASPRLHSLGGWVSIYGLLVAGFQLAGTSFEFRVASFLGLIPL